MDYLCTKFHSCTPKIYALTGAITGETIKRNALGKLWGITYYSLWTRHENLFSWKYASSYINQILGKLQSPASQFWLYLFFPKKNITFKLLLGDIILYTQRINRSRSLQYSLPAVFEMKTIQCKGHTIVEIDFKNDMKEALLVWKHKVWWKNAQRNIDLPVSVWNISH